MGNADGKQQQQQPQLQQQTAGDPLMGGVGGSSLSSVASSTLSDDASSTSLSASSSTTTAEDIPYTSYSLSRSPTKGVTTASSPSASAPTLVTSARGFFNSNNDGAADAGIITIKSASGSSAASSLDEEERELNGLRPLQPILKSSVGAGSAWPFGTLPKDVETIDPKPFITICHDFQEYCRRNAAMVVQQERVLTQNIRTAEALCLKTLQTLSQHAMEMQQYQNHIREVTSLPGQISRANELVRDIVLFTQKLNALLPQNDQLPQLKLGATSIDENNKNGNNNNNNNNNNNSSSSNNKADNRNNTSNTNNNNSTTTMTNNDASSNNNSNNNNTIKSVHNDSSNSNNNNNNNNNSDNSNSKGEETIKVKSGVASEQGARPTMEDSHVAIDNLSIATKKKNNSNSNQELTNLLLRSRFYAVYDGHGGSQTALESGKKLHKYIVAQEEFVQGDYETAVRKAYCAMDKRVLAQSERYRWSDGSTAATLLMIDNTIIVANCGDSEIVLGTKRGSANGHLVPLVLTQNHKPYDRDERSRIEQAGGAVIFGRVMGSLAVSRALGDFSFKVPMNAAEKDFVTAVPFVRTLTLNREDEVVILACDGLWDVIPYDRAVTIAEKARREGKSPEDAAKLLVQTALKSHSQDNVTVVVLYLSW